MTDTADTDLRQSIHDAQRLLRHASERGLPLPEDLVRDIVGAKTLLAADDTDPATFAQQQAFWGALRQLAAAVAPASMATIRYSETNVAPTLAARIGARFGRVTRPITAGEAAVRRAGHYALFWLVLVCLCQWYVEVASTTLRLYATNKAAHLRAVSQLEQIPEASRSTEREIELRVEIDGVKRETERQLAIMEKLLPRSGISGAQNTGERTTQILAATEFYLTMLRGFLLPALWGLIGAALYVLRTLAQQLSTTAYSPDHATLHRSRYYLGAVAGFVVAKFSQALSGKVLDDTIQPFVLALLVGYSVDVLFNLLAKLIEAFSPSKSTDTTASAK